MTTKLETWANRIAESCLEKAGGDVDVALEAAKYIVATQPFPQEDAAPAPPSPPPAYEPIEAFLAHDIFNRQAQGILNHALQLVRGLTASARKDLVAALKKGGTGSGEAILNFIDKYRVQLAKILTRTQLAAVLEGAQEVAGKVPTLTEFPGAIPPPPTLEPAKAVALVERLERMTPEKQAEKLVDLPAAEQVYVRQAIAARAATPPLVPPLARPRAGAAGPDDVHFPTIDEAVKNLAERNVMSRPQFDALEAAARAKAFTVANVEAEETLTKLRDSLAKNVEEGADYETWRKKVMEDVDQGTFLSDGHQETVFRTNVQTAFSDGQEAVLAHPLIRSGFPYRVYDAIHDDRVREEHLAMDTHGIGGTNIYRADDPVIQLFRPPWDYNCVLPGNFVSGKIIGALKSLYSGYAVEITTANGANTTLTVNHPVLTEDGFIPAGRLKKGYNLVCHLGKQEGLRGLDHVQHCPSFIEDVFKTINAFRYREPLEAFDFDGDEQFMMGEVDMVSTYLPLGKHIPRQLEGKGQVDLISSNNSSMGGTGLGNSLFVGHSRPLNSLGLTLTSYRDFSGSQHSSNGSSAQIHRNGNAVFRLARNISTDDLFVVGGNSSTNCYSLGLASELDTVFSQPTPDGVALNSNIVSELLEGFPSKVSSSKVVNVRHFWYSGPVYDLETVPGYFTTTTRGAASIIIRNCRCSITPITVRHAAELGIDEAQKWLSTGVEPADKAFVKMPPFEPRPGFQRSVSAAPLSIQLSMRPPSLFLNKDPSPYGYGSEPKPPSPPTVWTEDDYPRNNSNQFVSKYDLTSACQCPDVEASVRESVPEDQRWKLDKALGVLRMGGTVHHPKEPPGLGINSHGIIEDSDWRWYSDSLDRHAAWQERDILRSEQVKTADKIVKLIRKDAPDLDELEVLLKEIGAEEKDLRAVSRMRYKVEKKGTDTSLLEELYEEVVEGVYQRIESEEEEDREPEEPEEPETEGTVALAMPMPMPPLSGEQQAVDEHRAFKHQMDHRLTLISEILVMLFGNHAESVARKLVMSGMQNLAFSMDAQGIWHGPTPPAPSGWNQIAPGPQGGLRWAHVGGLAGAQQSVAQHQPAQQQQAAVSPPPAAPPPPPVAPTGKYAAAHQQRFAAATQAYNGAMATLNAWGTLTPATKVALAKHLSVMNKPQLKALHAALGGTAVIISAQRQPLVHAIKNILAGGSGQTAVPTPTPTPAGSAAPVQTAPSPTKSLHSTIPFSAEVNWETGKPQPGVVLNGIPFEPAPPKFWEKVKDVDVGEPLPVTGKKVDRVGILIQEPDGRVWIVQPTDGMNFCGRKYTLPGGRVEPGLTDQQNTLKETWEETGIQCEITGYLGDFEDSNNSNNGRLYVGKRTGGAPWDAKIESHIINKKTGKPTAESEVVTLVTPEKAAKLLHRTDDLAQLAAVYPIDIKTNPRSNVIDKIVRGIQPAVEQYKKKKRGLGQDVGNANLHVVQQWRGFNGKPKVVSKKDMDSLIAKGEHIEVLRGVSSGGNMSAKQVADQFKSGDHYPGSGIFGSGTYTDATKGGSNAVTSGNYGSTGGNIRIAIPKTAKMIKVSELEKLLKDTPKAFYYADNGSSEEEWRGVQAALAGYDVIVNDNAPGTRHYGYGRGFHVILNRSIMTVQQEDAGGHIII